MDATAGQPTSDSTVTELRNQLTSTVSSTATVGQHDTGASGPIFASWQIKMKIGEEVVVESLHKPVAVRTLITM